MTTLTRHIDRPPPMSRICIVIVSHLHRPYRVLGQDILAAEGDGEVAELLGVGEHAEIVLGGGGEQGHDDGHLSKSNYGDVTIYYHCT